MVDNDTDVGVTESTAQQMSSSPPPSRRRTSIAQQSSSTAVMVEKGRKEADTELPVSQHIHRKMSLLRGISTIVSLMIGSGIFSTPGEIHRLVGSMSISFAVWAATGVLSLLGALCYAELGTTLPGSGGEPQYLLRGFGPLPASIFDWISIAVLKPGSVTITANHFARHALILFYLLWTPSLQAPVLVTGPNGPILQSPEQLFLEQHRLVVAGIACAMIIVVTALAMASTTASTRIIDSLTLSKVGALFLIVTAGIVSIFVRPAEAAHNFIIKQVAVRSGADKLVSSWPSPGQLCLAMNQGLWSFEGWNNLNIVAGDLQNPARNLPLAIWSSVLSVLGLYLAALFGYYLVVDADIVKQSTIVAVEFGKLAFRTNEAYSRWGAAMMAMFVCASTLAAALSSMVTSSEIIMLSARRGFLSTRFSTISRWGTAANAYALQGVLAILLLLPLVLSPASGADNLMTFYSLPTWLFYAACVGVLLVLRVREPALLRPYRVLVSTPILFLAACAMLVGGTAYGTWIPVTASLAVTLLGIPIFWHRAKLHPQLLRWH